MTVIAWALAALWGLVLLASARHALRGLPPPVAEVPPYALWMPAGGDPPPLEPAPARTFVGELPQDGPDRLLVLGPDVRVSPELPARLAACGAFVSVFPRPRGGLVRLAVERLLRDFANPPAVVDAAHPAAYADARCAWLRRRDLALPAVGDEPVLRAARARKAHGLPVELRDGHAGDDFRGPPVIAARGLAPAGLRARVPDLTAPEPVARALMVGLPLLMNLGPWLLLLADGARGPAWLAIGLGTAARFMTAVRDGFGHLLTIAGWALDPALALVAAAAPRAPVNRTMPEVPAEAPALTGARGVEVPGWVDASAVAHLARRLGGAGPVMEQIYENHPAGRTRLGRLVDRWIHASPAARAVRHRWVTVGALGRRLAPRRVLSVPCGSARDVAAIAPAEAVLVDPDPAARALAAARCPGATVVDGTVATAPEGPFDLVIYVGLAEYLDDAEVVRHLVALRGRLGEDGALLTSTTAPHDSQKRMNERLGWQTRPRTAEAMTALLETAGFEVDRRGVDPLGIQWVFVARPRLKTPSGPSAAV